MLTMLIAPLTALANDSRWSGGVVITKEYAISRSTTTIYTLALDYRLADWWYIDFIIDGHPALGVDGDVSTTFYLPEWSGRTIYLSIGARAGLWRSARPPTVYWSVAFRF
jgi:hypothetical protein